MATIADMVSTDSASVTVFPVPGPNGVSYRYRDSAGRLSRDNYANAESARYDARRLQVVDKNGRVEPLERAARFGRFNG